jgi:hypothetical protein
VEQLANDIVSGGVSLELTERRRGRPPVQRRSHRVGYDYRLLATPDQTLSSAQRGERLEAHEVGSPDRSRGLQQVGTLGPDGCVDASDAPGVDMELFLQQQDVESSTPVAPLLVLLVVW